MNDLMAVTPSNILLAETKRVALLEKISESSALDAERFDNFYLNLLNKFTNHCQSLPETANNYYALPGGLLDCALNRTEAALHLFRHHVMQGDSTELSEEQKLWLYALFSAAMLKGIGKLQLDYRVELFDLHGQLLRTWNPLLESMTANARFYHYEFTEGGEEDLRRRLNLLFASQFMPEKGFNWIAGNPQVLAVWLALLNDDINAAGMLGLILERADAIALQRDLNALLIRTNAASGGRANRIGTFIDVAPESSIEKERALGAEFIKWLTIQLEKGRFSINKLPIMILPAGLHLTTETYQFFMRDHPEVKARNWQAVHNGLIALGLHHRDSSAYTDSQNIKNGIILDKFALILPDEVQLYNPTTGKEAPATAMDIMRIQKSLDNPEPMQQLTHAGTWITVETHEPALQSGYSRRE